MTKLDSLVLAAVGQGRRGKSPASVIAEVLLVDPEANTKDIWEALKRLRDTGEVERLEQNREYGFGYFTYRRAK